MSVVLLATLHWQFAAIEDQNGSDLVRTQQIDKSHAILDVPTNYLFSPDKINQEK
jgi:hypothetical protein